MNATPQTPLKLPGWSRLVLLAAALLAAFQIKVGVEGMQPAAIVLFTLGFGVLLVAALMIILLSVAFLDSQALAVVASLLPLSFAAGLAAEFSPSIAPLCFAGAALGFLAILLTRLWATGRAANLTLALVHGAAGIMIVMLPIALYLNGAAAGRFLWVSAGGALMGLGGLALFFLKSGRLALTKGKALAALPVLMLFMTAAFVIGLG